MKWLAFLQFVATILLVSAPLIIGSHLVSPESTDSLYSYIGGICAGIGIFLGLTSPDLGLNVIKEMEKKDDQTISCCCERQQRRR
jgi:hypothetical protein